MENQIGQSISPGRSKVVRCVWPQFVQKLDEPETHFFGLEAWGPRALSGCIKFTLFKKRKNSGAYGGGSVTGVFNGE